MGRCKQTPPGAMALLLTAQLIVSPCRSSHALRCSVLRLLLVVALGAGSLCGRGVHGQDGKCTDEDVEASGGGEASTVCFLSVTLTRQPDCSVLVKEVFVLPRTNASRPLYRAIPHIQLVNDSNNVDEDDESNAGDDDDGAQRISYIRHERDGAPAEFSADAWCEADEQTVVTLETTNSSSEAEHTLYYRLSNGASRFGRACAASGEAKAESNVVRWRSGLWDLPIRRVSVRLESRGAKLRVASAGPDGGGDEGENGGEFKDDSVTFEDDDFGSESQEVYFEEQELPLCPYNLSCFAAAGEGRSVAGQGGGGIGAGWIAILVIVIVLLLLFLLFCLCKNRRSGGGGDGGGGSDSGSWWRRRRHQPIQALGAGDDMLPDGSPDGRIISTL